MTPRAQTLKVYAWQAVGGAAMLRAFPDWTKPWNTQVRYIVAAYSQTEAARLAGYTHPRQMFNLGETGNASEIAQAMECPHTVLWRPLDAANGVPYVKAPRRAGEGRASS